jgi:hypothetical protein
VITCGCPIEYKEKGKSNPRNRKIKQKKEFLNKFLASENIKIEFRKIEEKAIKVMYPYVEIEKSLLRIQIANPCK